MVGSSFPDEEEQYWIYREAVQKMDGKPVTIRTMDLGSDKKLPYIKMSDEDTHVLLAIREVCDILMPMALGKDVTLHCCADPDGESGILDGAKIRQVLYNLVSNAIKFSKQGGKVTVVSGPDGNGGILLRVIDQGIGIRKDDIPKLFRQFQQLDSGSARHYPGSGLGLVITKKLVELHGGTVEVESVFGEGSIFSAVFPRFAGDE